MKPQQERHLKDILKTSRQLINKKYRAGQEHHGGNLFDLTAAELIDEAINEAIDQMVYLITLKDKLNGKTKRHPAKLHRKKV